MNSKKSNVLIWREESEVEKWNKRITELEETVKIMELEDDNNKKHIKELEKWIAFMSESVYKPQSEVANQINNGLKTLDQLFVE